ISSGNSPLRAAAVTRSIIVATLESIADSHRVLTQKRHYLGEVKVGTFALTQSRLEETRTHRRKVTSRRLLARKCRNICRVGTTPIGDLINIVEPRLFEARPIKSQRRVERHRR